MIRLKDIEDGLAAIRRGEVVLLFDREGREEETDMVIGGEFVKPRHVREMRSEAGGLLCLAVSWNTAQRLGLPFMDEVFEVAREKFPILFKLEANDIPYGDRSAFSITINHRQTFTGISDTDRALTISEFAKLARKANGHMNDEHGLREEFGSNFRSPGHVHLLIGDRAPTTKRQGHTELSIALAEMAGVTPITLICEMLDGSSEKSLSKQEALNYAKTRGLVFLEGSQVSSDYQRFRRQ